MWCVQHSAETWDSSDQAQAEAKGPFSPLASELEEFHVHFRQRTCAGHIEDQLLVEAGIAQTSTLRSPTPPGAVPVAGTGVGRVTTPRAGHAIWFHSKNQLTLHGGHKGLPQVSALVL